MEALNPLLDNFKVGQIHLDLIAVTNTVVEGFDELDVCEQSTDFGLDEQKRKNRNQIICI